MFEYFDLQGMDFCEIIPADFSLRRIVIKNS